MDAGGSQVLQSIGNNLAFGQRCQLLVVTLHALANHSMVASGRCVCVCMVRLFAAISRQVQGAVDVSIEDH